MYKTLYRAQYRESDNAFKYKAPVTLIHHTCSDNQPDRQTAPKNFISMGYFENSCTFFPYSEMILKN